MVSVHPAVIQKKRKKERKKATRPIYQTHRHGWLSKFKTGDGGIRNECVL